MRNLLASCSSSVAIVSLFAAVACKEDKPPPAPVSAPPAASASAPAAVGESTYVVQTAGKASVLIDAPLEKFKGETPALGGYLRLNPTNLKATTGTVTVNLEPFTTHTFGDKDKDETQTEHVHNWFEIGDDVKKGRPKEFEAFRMVVFKIESVDEVSEPDLRKVTEADGARTVTVKTSGTLWVHSRPAKKQVSMQVSFKGPADAPTQISFKTTTPVDVSLATHDVKPRDTAGKFIDGALSVVGKKIDDKAQVSVEGTAKLDVAAQAAASAAAESMLAMHGTMASASAMPSVAASAAKSAMPPSGSTAKGQPK
jgi:hypothetical protein